MMTSSRVRSLIEPTGEQITSPSYVLPASAGYPEAIRDQAQIDALVAHFRPHIRTREDERMFQGALYNPLNIEYIARHYHIPCPQGYSEAEMQVHIDATLNAMVPCRICGTPIRRHGRAYEELGGRCNWDCYESSDSDYDDTSSAATQ